MNRKKYILLTLILSLLCIPKIYASCTQEEINEFKEIEDEYKITYEFNKSTKDYTLTFPTPYTDKYGYLIDKKIDISKNATENEKSFVVSRVSPGTYTIEIYAFTETCDGSVKTIELNLPGYNNYSEDPLCIGIEEFYLCQPTYDKEVDRATFESRVNTYKKTKEKESNEIIGPVAEENHITKYIQENMVQIIIIIIFIILLVITTIVTAISIRKSRRLE